MTLDEYILELQKAQANGWGKLRVCSNDCTGNMREIHKVSIAHLRKNNKRQTARRFAYSDEEKGEMVIRI